jgi:hypothetical protein
MSKARRNASTQPAAGGYISLSLAAHDDGPKIGLSQGGVPAVETNKRIGRGSAPRGASCSSIDPADYPVAPDSDRRDDRARPVRVNGKCMLIARTKESRQLWCFARPCPARRRILALHTYIRKATMYIRRHAAVAVMHGAVYVAYKRKRLGSRCCRICFSRRRRRRRRRLVVGPALCARSRQGTGTRTHMAYNTTIRLEPRTSGRRARQSGVAADRELKPRGTRRPPGEGPFSLFCIRPTTTHALHVPRKHACIWTDGAAGRFVYAPTCIARRPEL